MTRPQPRSTASYYTENLTDRVELKMVRLPSGSFWMGTEEREVARLNRAYNVNYNFRAETPQHEVKIPAFAIGCYPITQEQWQIVARWEKVNRELDPNPSQFQDDYQAIARWQRPVESISWEDAREFCARLSRKTQKDYRLPTEAQWEYACRSVIAQNLTVEEWNRKHNRSFHFGDKISPDLANYNGNYIYGKNIRGKDRNQTTPVGHFKITNNWGLYDLHGNVWEWCEDDYHSSYQGAPTDGSAWLSGGNSVKILRGGSCFLSPRYCRSACRAWDTMSDRGSGFGLRVVLLFEGN